METIADRLRQLLADQGIKQTQLARDLSITPSSVSTMCSGKSNPASQTINAICRIYHVNENWLRCGEGSMYNSTTQSEDMAILTADAMNLDAAKEREALIAKIQSMNDGEIVLLAQLLKKFKD